MEQDKQPRLSTGIAGLDDVLRGGLAKGFLYLTEGNPGAGKTTLAMQFLIAGAQPDETGLYIWLAESEPELRHVAESHGFDPTFGEPLKEFIGVFTGTPHFEGGQTLL